MRKILLLLGVFFTFCALPAQAQFTLVTGTVKDVNGLAYAGGTISASLVVPGGTSPTLNGVGFTGTMSPIGLDSTGSFTARLADNNVILPGGTQWKFLVNITGGAPPLGTGPQTCTATLTITGASQSVTASFSACPALSNVISGGGAFSSLTGGTNTTATMQVGGTASLAPTSTGTVTANIVPSTTVAGLPSAASANGQTRWVTDANVAGSCSTGGGSTLILCFSNGTSWVGTSASQVTSTDNFIDPTLPPYNVVPDVAFIGNDGVTANGANTLTSVTLNCSTTNNGKLVIVVNASNFNYPFGTGLVTQTGCNSSTVATVSTNAGANFGSGQAWAIGTDWGATINSATTAAWSSTKGLLAPCGAMIVASPPFVTGITTASWINAASVSGCLNVPGTMFILHPQITNGLAANAAFFYQMPTWTGYVPTGGTDSDVNNIRVTALGGNIPMSVVLTGFLGAAASLRMRGVQLQAIGSTNASNCTLAVAPSGEGYYDLMNAQNNTCTVIKLQGQGPNVISNSIIALSTVGVSCASGVQCTLAHNYMPQNTTTITANGNANIDIIGGSYSSIGTSLISQTSTGNVINISDGAFFSTANNTANGLFNTTGYTLNLNGGQFGGTGTSTNLFNGTGTVFDSSPFNKFTPINGGLVANGPSWFGDGSASGTTSVAGNLVLSAGWGTTAANTAVSGSTKATRFTLTASGTGQAANPTITWTYAAPYPSGVVPICQIKQDGGTQAAVANPFTVGTPTATSVVFTYTGTPGAGNTLILLASCANP